MTKKRVLVVLVIILGVFASNVVIDQTKIWLEVWQEKYILSQVEHYLAGKEFTVELKTGTKKPGSKLELDDMRKALYVFSIRNMQLSESIRTVREFANSAPVEPQETN